MFIKDCIRGDIEFAMKERHIKDYKDRAKKLIELFDLQDIQEEMDDYYQGDKCVEPHLQ